MKRALCLFFAILFAFSFSSCVFTPSHAYPEKTFTQDGLTLILTEAFSFAEPAPEGMTFALESTQVVVFVKKEPYERSLDDLHNEVPMRVHVSNYVLALREANLDKSPSGIVMDTLYSTDENGETVETFVYHFTYTTEDDYTYFTTAVLGTDVAYTIQFVTRTSTARTYRSYLVGWTARAVAE